MLCRENCVRPKRGECSVQILRSNAAASCRCTRTARESEAAWWRFVVLPGARLSYLVAGERGERLEEGNDPVAPPRQNGGEVGPGTSRSGVGHQSEASPGHQGTRTVPSFGLMHCTPVPAQAGWLRARRAGGNLRLGLAAQFAVETPQHPGQRRRAKT